MPDRKVLDAESAFLLLKARRVFNATKQAKARGEEYHDLSSYEKLSCGYHAKMIIHEGTPSPWPELAISIPPGPLPLGHPQAIVKVAEEILGGPVLFAEEPTVGGPHRFIKKPV